MRDAELIYNALLRAERRLEQRAAESTSDRDSAVAFAAALGCARIIREEIERGINEAYPR